MNSAHIDPIGVLISLFESCLQARPHAAIDKVYAGWVKPLPANDLEGILKQTRPLWDEARGRSIFLSGCTGFFGAWLLESLAFCNRTLSLNLSATVLSRDPDAFARKMPHLVGERSIRFFKGDVRNFSFPDQYFDYVIHGAASTSAEAALAPLELMHTLLEGTERMLAFSKSNGVKKFLLISSGAVYGKQPDSLSHIPEDYLGGPDWINPVTAYGEGKRVCEQMCSVYARESDIGFASARCFTFVGPHLPLDKHFAIGNFIRDALAGRNIEVRGDGTTLRSYLYTAELATWLWTILFRGTQTGPKLRVFNVGSKQAISIHDLAQEVVAELNPSLAVQIAQEPNTNIPPSQYVPDIDRARDLLGLNQSIGLREAIRRTADWYR
jgi:dTDP-glucose 4,6-dehydratase